MKIEKVKISNFLSVEDAEIAFDDTGMMLIKGWDHDNGRANGAGKTALVNAVSFALYDKLPRKVTASEILRRGSKSGFVEVTLSVGSDRYTVVRSRPKGVRFLGSNNEALTITQEEWESKLKLNYNQFTMIAYCAQGTSNRFLSVNDADKKKFLLQLLDLDGFASAKKHADEQVKNLTIQQDGYRSKINAIDAKVDAYQESLCDPVALKAGITQAEASIVALTKELLKEQAVVKPDLSKYQKVEDDIQLRQVEFNQAKARRSLLHESYRKLAAKGTHFLGSDTCLSCGSQLDNSAAKAAHEKELETRALELADLKNQIDACDMVLAKESQVLDLATKIKDKKRLETSDYDKAVLNARELSHAIKTHQTNVQNLNLKLQNNSELENKIKVLTESRNKLQHLVSDTQSQIELYKTVSAMYSPTGAQAYILDSVIENFNDSVQEYVKLLWSNMSYSLLSYKENVTGDVSAKFSEQLTMDGKEISIGSLSGGEYRALSLCVDFALMDVMEKQFGIYVSPIFLDEPFDGLDSEGRELIIEFLGKLSSDRHIIVIDHASEVKSMFSKTLMVEKRNGISSISQES